MATYKFDLGGRQGEIDLDQPAVSPAQVESFVRSQAKKGGVEVPDDAPFRLLEGDVQPPSAVRRALGAVKQAVGGPPLESYESTGGMLAGAGRKAAAAVIPGSGLEAAAMVGTAGAGAVASKLAMAPLKAAILRLFGGAVGGELGGQLEGEQTGTGAAVGALGAGVGEASAAVGGKIARSLSGVRGKVLKKETERLASNIGQAVKPLRGVRTAQDLFEAARDRSKGLFLLGDYMEGTLQLAERRLARAAKKTVPPTPQTAGPTSMYMRSGALEWDKLSVPALGDAKMTLREAGEALKEIGQKGFGGAKAEPTARTVVAKGTRETYDAALHQIHRELARIDPTGVTGRLFEHGRQQYSVGVALLQLLKNRNAFKGLPAQAGAKEGVELNLPWLKKEFAQRLGYFKERLPQRDYAALVDLFYRGAPVGAADVFAPGRGAASDALEQFLRGRNTGAAQSVRVPVLSLLPGLGDRWAGRTPAVLGAGGRTIADVLGIHAMDEARRGASGGQ